MKGLKHQQGVTAMGWVIILGLIAFFAFLALKLFPIFVENFNIKSSLASLEKEDGVNRMSNTEIRRLISRKLDINGIELGKNDLKIGKRDGYLIVEIKYERVEHMAGPISILAEFNERIEVVR